MDVTPWYKQFWPWFLICVPLSSMVFSFYFVALSVETQDSLVVDDYYKEGKAINLDLEKQDIASELNIEGSLSIDANNVSLTLSPENQHDGSALTLSFHHATLKQRDFSVLLTLNAKGEYRSEINHDIGGKWQLRLSPFDKRWTVQQVVSLPRTSAIPFGYHE